MLLTALIFAACALTLSVALAAHAWPRFAGPLALAAFTLSGLAWIARGLTFIRSARWRPSAARAVLAVRWMFLLLFFPLPGWLLGWGGGSLTAFWTAFALQLAALVADRWLFFAERRRPQGRQDEAGA
jgi:hypothetical protein